MGMSPQATRGRPRGFDRDVALDQAVRMFWDHGYAATSVRDLSESLGIGQPSLYSAFGDKRSLFAEVLQAYGSRYGAFIEAALAQEPTAAAAVRRILAEGPERYTRRGLPRGCLIVSGDEATDDEQVRAALSAVREQTTAGIRRRIEKDVAAGVLSEDTDAAGLASFVMAVLTGMARRARDGGTRRELTRTADVAQRALP